MGLQSEVQSTKFPLESRQLRWWRDNLAVVVAVSMLAYGSTQVSLVRSSDAESAKVVAGQKLKIELPSSQSDRSSTNAHTLEQTIQSSQEFPKVGEIWLASLRKSELPVIAYEAVEVEILEFVTVTFVTNEGIQVEPSYAFVKLVDTDERLLLEFGNQDSLRLIRKIQ